MSTHLVLLLNFLFFFAPPKGNVPKTIYEFKVPALEAGIINFENYRGKKILIVNTASECGNTPQYADLEKLSEKYKDKLVIVGFPCNDFGSQEPGSNADIAKFCKRTYRVKFPMAAKISVKGDSKHPLYQWLTEKQYNGYMDSEVKWNFQKYLINEKGELVAIFQHRTNPMSQEVTDAIEK